MKIEIDVDEEETFENSTQRNWREKVITFVADNRKIHIIRTEIRVFISRGVQSRWIFWHRRLISSRWSRNQYEFFDRISARQRRNKKKVVENRIKINKNGKKLFKVRWNFQVFFASDWLTRGCVQPTMFHGSKPIVDLRIFSHAYLQIHEISIPCGRVDLLLLFQATVVAGCHILIFLFCGVFLSVFYFSQVNPNSNLVRNSLKLHFRNISIEQLNAFSLNHTTIYFYLFLIFSCLLPFFCTKFPFLRFETGSKGQLHTRLPYSAFYLLNKLLKNSILKHFYW